MPTPLEVNQFDVKAVSSPLGGGWIIPLTPTGSQALLEFFNEEPYELLPLGGAACGAIGYIITASQTDDLTVHLHSRNCRYRTG